MKQNRAITFLHKIERMAKPIKAESATLGVSVLFGIMVPLLLSFGRFLPAYTCLVGSMLAVCYWWWHSSYAKTRTKIKRVYRYTSSRVRQFGGCTFFLLLFCVPGYYIYDGQRAKLASAMSGTLGPKQRGVATKALVEWGPSGPTREFYANNPTVEFLRDQGVKVEVVDGVPMISTVIRDKDGKQIVSIVRNRWWVNSSQDVALHRNFTSDRLKVLNAKGRVVLQVQILSDKIDLQLELHDEHGYGVRIFEDFNNPVPGGVTEIPLYTFENPADNASQQIQPAFRYPSSEHWGELLK